MPISGLRITLAADGAEARSACDELASCAVLELGRREGRYLAAVLDTETEDCNKQIWHWLTSRRGVVNIDVVFVGFDDAGDPQARPESERRSARRRCGHD